MLPTQYQEYIALSRYARWLPKENRRETWHETVLRCVSFWSQKYPDVIDPLMEAKLYDYIYSLKVMPSMRCMMTAGPALERDNVAGFNCAFTAIDNPKKFDEILYILACGTGVGFSVERQFIVKLPTIPDELYPSDTCIRVADSKLGWASGFRELVSLLYAGKIPTWDTSKVRPAGSPLKTFGGRASGPEPLENLFRFTVSLFKKAIGRRLTSIECHDLVCKTAECIVVGGVRRSALISLGNLSDDRMRVAKSGQWWVDNPQRAIANNSVAYSEKPDIGLFMKEWLSLYDSKSGERGIFNRQAAKNLLPERRKALGDFDWGCNPCSEIVLRPTGQFCNLSEVVVRPNDTFETLKQKVEVAAILGTLQATLTDFRYLSKEWKKNTAEEALLGVSLTGIMDHPVLNRSEEPYYKSTWSNNGFYDYGSLEEILSTLKQHAIDTNQLWAERLGINPATAVTCVKPSGTVSQLVDSASGIHPRYAPYYTRTVRADQKDPLAIMMKDIGVPCEKDAMKPDSGYVFSFPVKAPDNAVFRDDRSAIEQLELWKTYQLNWCEHKPSITVYVKEHEWMEVGSWVYENFDIVSGVSFLPHSDHTYQQAPYQEIDEKTYLEAKAYMDSLNIDWSKLSGFEKVDTTEGLREYACTAGACEIL